MSRPNDLGKLETHEFERLREYAERLEQAWQKGPPPSLAPFLPPDGDPIRQHVLLEQVKTDLEMRWRHGQMPRLEDYVEEWAELRPVRSLPADLVFWEYRVRQLRGDKPSLDEYRHRFPAQFTEVERMAQEWKTFVRPLAEPAASTALPPSVARSLISEDNILPVGGGYRLIRFIDAGSFAEVWQAEAPGGIPKAVKILSRPIKHEDAQREWESLEQIKTIRHKFLLQTDAVFLLEGHLIIVMELADGTLRTRLKECQQAGLPGIPIDELIGYMRETAEALDFMHARGLLHRDVKPQNILLQQRHIMVADFGLARLLESQRILASATVAGTPAYMAPEVWWGKVGPRSDQYSLAVTYAELRLGRRLFISQDIEGLRAEHITGTPDLSALPAAEQQALQRALSKNADERYPTCCEFVRALELACFPPATRSSWEMPAAAEAGRASWQGPAVGEDPGTIGRVSNAKVAASQPPVRLPGSRTEPLHRRRGQAFLTVTLGVLLGLIAWVAWQLLRPASVQLLPPQDLTLKTDGAATLALHVERTGRRQPVKLTFEGAPPGVTISDAFLEAAKDQTEVKMTAESTAAIGSYRVTVRAGGEPSQVASFRLTVLPRYWPEDGSWEAVPGTAVVTDAQGRTHYREIDVCRGEQRVRFLLIEQKKPQPGLPPDTIATFYMMRDKVWVALLRPFAETRPDDPQLQALVRAPDRLPALGVPVDVADAFAAWLGGKIPSVAQWEKAAGLTDLDGWRGPYLPPGEVLGAVGLGPLTPSPAHAAGALLTLTLVPGIAVDRKAPLDVGTAWRDVSPYGCRDMGGNGWEWTQDVERETRRARVPLNSLRPGDKVWLRGLSYLFDEPLDVVRLRFNPQLPQFILIDPFKSESLNVTGFRVVIEP